MNGPFKILFREFFGQFFASESATSDIRLRQAIIGVFAFLITPGWIFSAQMFPAYAYAVARAPELIEPITRLLASLFLMFSTVAIGLIAAFVWESLSFDRRDAMVLGPMPVTRTVVVSAKLAALGAFLLIACLSINVMTAVPFSMVASGHKSFVQVVRHFVAHMVTVTYAAAWIFSIMVLLRTILVMYTRGTVAGALTSLLQFAFVSGLLCFFILTPMALQMNSRGPGRPMSVQLAEFPAWLPTGYFLSMYEQLRGTADAHMVAVGQRTALATLALIAVTVLMTMFSYRRQLQLALTPSASTGAVGGARIARAIAGAMLGRNRVAKATCDFILMTIARNRAQQAPIAINAAIGLALVILNLAWMRGGVAAALQTPAILLAVPLILVFWTSIGLRAALFVPSELPCSWVFRANAPAAHAAYALATRAAIAAFVGPSAIVIAGALAFSIRGWPGAIQHGLWVAALVLAMADFIALTVHAIPFTRPYEPGHARLKTRWPLYLLGANGFAHGLANLELLVWNDRQSFLILLAGAAVVIALFEVALRTAGRRWSTAEEDVDPDREEQITVLDLSGALPRQA